ncbi:MAG: phosphodiester glycosidase family protein [Deltaproteobacteria bacterium]|nr:phosphodiester glycosidase family protein [Deltaproteobacteria bacterium]
MPVGLRLARTWLASLGLGVALLPSLGARADDVWSDPLPGVRHLHRTTSSQNVHVLVVSLCAAGISFRATAEGERGRTPSSFASLVGAHAVINGDFYGPSFAPNGMAMHDGVAWGGDDHTYVGPLAFGDRRVALVPHEDTAGPQPWMREVVSGHPTVLQGGAMRDNSGDPLCTNRHPRTAVGLSADRRTLYMAVIDGRATGRIGMTCPEIASLMAELGASDALNLDGGGSSAMWLAGAGVLNNPSDGSERTVSNHLALYATGSGPAVSCPNAPPEGSLDRVDCDVIGGWARDPDEPARAIDAHVYIGGPAGDPMAVGYPLLAGLSRPDLCTALGSCEHAFELPVPRGFLDGVERQVFVYGIDTGGGDNALLGNAPRPLRCDTPALPALEPAGSVRRHVASPEILAAWSFDTRDVAHLDDAALVALDEGPDVSPAPVLVRAEDGAAIYVREGAVLRHVPDPAAMAAWHLSFDAVMVLPAADVDALVEGAPLLARPFLAQGGGPEVWLVDHPPPLRARLVSHGVPDFVEVDREVPVAFQLRNRGTLAWEPGEVWLATTEPRGRDSALCDAASWRDCAHAATLDAPVAPGSDATFRVTLRGSRAALGVVDECFGLVYRDAHFFGDPGLGGPADDAVCVSVEVLEPGMPPTRDAGIGARDGGGGTTRDAGTTGVEDESIRGGCGCAVPGHARRSGLAIGCLAMLLAGVVATRARRSSRRVGPRRDGQE